MLDIIVPNKHRRAFCESATYDSSPIVFYLTTV
jgi:hypothetical protein